MKYLLDTDVVIDHIKGKRIIRHEISEGGMGISIITYGELLYGAEKSQQKEKSFSIIIDFIKIVSIEIFDLDKEIMAEYAFVKANLETAGQRLDNFDLLIGASAKQHKLTLVTRNIKHFERIKGLKIISG